MCACLWNTDIMIYYYNSYLLHFKDTTVPYIKAMSLSSFLGNSCFGLVATLIIVADKLLCCVLVLDTKLLLCNNLFMVWGLDYSYINSHQLVQPMNLAMRKTIRNEEDCKHDIY